MRDAATRTLETLGLLHATPFGVDRWPRVLDAIADLIGGNGALLFVEGAGPAELQLAARSTRYKLPDVEQYLSSFVKDEEARWLRDLDAAPPRTIRRDTDIWPDRLVYDAMPSVRFLRELHLYHRVAVRPCAHGGWKDSLAVLYDDRRGGIRSVEAQRLVLLVPHLARAIERQRPFRLLQRRFGRILAALDRLGIGVVVAREAGEIVLSNCEADRILDAEDGLRRDARARLLTSDPDTGAGLTAAIRRAQRSARLEQDGGAETLEIPRRIGRSPYLVDVAPLRDDGDELEARFDGVLLFLVDPDHREMVSIEGLARVYSLSPKETLVCRLLAQGLTLREIAESRGVSLDTVKSQARAIYIKSNTRNRGELVRRALSIVPPLTDGAGRRIN